MIRTLQAELLDALPADRPGAIHSRRDLRRLNALMGHAGIIARSLKTIFPDRPPQRILEIGAGDGELLLRVARRLSKKQNPKAGEGRGEEAVRAPAENTIGAVDVLFIDLQNLLREETKTDFAALSWRVRSVEADIFQWLNDHAAEKTDVILGNLVVHHFTDAQLATLFSAITHKADAFIAVEPRRSGWPLFWTRWLSLIGCNPVTCHDAPISVRAGFTGRELSALWPQDGTWELTERRAGLFSHLFVARRKG